MTENQSLAVRTNQTDEVALMTIDAVKGRLNAVHQLMQAAMVRDGDFGVIPGTGSKPTLLKPGAEKLCTLFRLSPTYSCEVIDMGKFHREYRVTCTLTHIPTAAVWGQGLASCSTMESKYRWRKGERKCPRCGKTAIIKGKEEFGGGWLCFAKKDGCGAKFNDDDPIITSQEVGKQENPDIADQYNTVLKMATKRALVAAVLITTGASALFTQDIEDYADEEKRDIAPTPPATPQPPRKQVQNQVEGLLDTPAQPQPGEQEFIDIIVECKKGKGGTNAKTGKPWQIYNITTKTGTKIVTFSSTLADDASKAVKEAVPVKIVWKDDGKGPTLVELLSAEPQAAYQGEDALPY